MSTLQKRYPWRVREVGELRGEGRKILSVRKIGGDDTKG
jgi:hypothetical protein